LLQYKLISDKDLCEDSRMLPTRKATRNDTFQQRTAIRR
jgi:hypothetical protein